MMVLYKNKRWLEKKYLKEKLSTIELSIICGVVKSTVLYWIRKYNIPRRSNSESKIMFNNSENAKYHNREWLKYKYINEKLNACQIAKICNVNSETIYNWLRKFHIPIRSYSESNHLRQANHCNLSQETIDFINGELLGDGSLQSISKYSANFRYTSKYYEYIQYISDTLKSFGIEQSGKIYKNYCKKSNQVYYHYASLNYIELLSIYKQWYIDGKKIIPKDLILNSLISKQFYISDGYIEHPKNAKPRIRLAACDFSIADTERLVNQLNQLGFKATRNISRNIIAISTSSTKDFLDYIGICPVNCYQYKFKY
jgi:hypothetical protein